jgi:hypothetical protein
MRDKRVTLTMKIDPRLMARIDEAREDESRAQYVPRWLPEYWEWREGDNAADTTQRIDERAAADHAEARRRVDALLRATSSPPA